MERGVNNLLYIKVDMKFNNWIIESPLKPVQEEAAFVGFSPTVYILDFIDSDGRVFTEKIILYELPSKEVLELAIIQTIQKLELTKDMERRNAIR